MAQLVERKMWDVDCLKENGMTRVLHVFIQNELTKRFAFEGGVIRAKAKNQNRTKYTL
jgi:hypothetical protein